MLNNIVDNIEQCGQHNIVKAVFINPEQVVRFYACNYVMLKEVQLIESLKSFKVRFSVVDYHVFKFPSR